MKLGHRFAFSLWLRVMMLIILTAAVFCYAMFQGGFQSWFLFYAFLPYALYALLFALVPLESDSEKDFTTNPLEGGRRAVR
ncbi:hypothetical protein ACEQPO_04280 [Bacillus sp. SL00103]